LFRLRANPTKRIGKSDAVADERFKDADKRRRVELRTDEERINWLKRKGAEAGFRFANVRIAPAVENVATVEQGKITSRKYDKDNPDKRHTLTFGSVTFEGVLQVIDADKFRESLVQGIGTGKAYGFGLLSIAPVKES
jgi:CRISPR system Cascade subunit CasE